MTEETYGPRTSAWKELSAKAAELRSGSIRSLFSADPNRGVDLSQESVSLYVDFSRQLLEGTSLALLYDLAEQTGVPAGIGRMFSGAHINNTEDRAALHVALRRPADRPLLLDSEDVMPFVEAERRRMKSLSDRLHAGELRGYTGKQIVDVVNIGIGGSDLGLVMATVALVESCNPEIGLHFVSNIDGVEVSHVLKAVDPETTLFVICSKSFTTIETLTNARTVRDWLLKQGGERAIAAQFVAVSTNHEAIDEFGIAADRRFAIWDWVGGRFSLWSAVGLTLALAIGWDRFSEFLAGAHEMDEHFVASPVSQNLPVLMALLGIWNRNFLELSSHAVLPYDDHLRRLPAYLQQLEMESNGKSVRMDGSPVQCDTCPVIWGEPGSNAQHSFFQLLHQGTVGVSMDFLLPVRSAVGRQDQQDLAAANCLAQTWALSEGDPQNDSEDPHQVYPGNRPSTLVIFDEIDPATLGRLVALYEHKVYVQGIIWDINSFDQWGVQLGKRLAESLTKPAASGAPPPAISAAIARLARSAE
ncbi:MAG: glucose-6-phosphate isomerase [Candidatus Rariloculaceae bacterium]